MVCGEEDGDCTEVRKTSLPVISWSAVSLVIPHVHPINPPMHTLYWNQPSYSLLPVFLPLHKNPYFSIFPKSFSCHSSCPGEGLAQMPNSIIYPHMDCPPHPPFNQIILTRLRSIPTELSPSPASPPSSLVISHITLDSIGQKMRYWIWIANTILKKRKHILDLVALSYAWL